MLKRWFAAPLLLAASITCADTIWRCPGADGQPVFSNQPCDGAEAVTLQPLGEISSMPARPARRQATPDTPRQPARQHTTRKEGPLSYSERTRWRQLNIERDGLERDLRRGQLHSRERDSAQARLRAVRQELAPLEQRARQHPPSP